VVLATWLFLVAHDGEQDFRIFAKVWGNEIAQQLPTPLDPPEDDVAIVPKFFQAHGSFDVLTNALDPERHVLEHGADEARMLESHGARNESGNGETLPGGERGLHDLRVCFQWRVTGNGQVLHAGIFVAELHHQGRAVQYRRWLVALQKVVRLDRQLLGVQPPEILRSCPFLFLPPQ